MPEFIKRDEFSAEVKALREDIKEHSTDLARSLETVKLTQAVSAKQIEGLEDSPRLQAIKESLDTGFLGINARLDRLNGTTAKHSEKIAIVETRTEGNADKIEDVNKQVTGLISQMLGASTPIRMSRKAKMAVAAGGGISGIAVIHAVAEMLSKIPWAEIFKIFKG